MGLTKYEKEFKVMISELLISGQSVKKVSEEYKLDASMIRKWKKAYESDRLGQGFRHHLYQAGH